VSLLRAALGGELDLPRIEKFAMAADRALTLDGRGGFSTGCPQASTTRGWRRLGLAGLRG
jgi:hypothetical protein